MTNNEIDIPPEKIRYFCSEDGLEFNSYFGAQQHINKSEGCRLAGATVRAVTHEQVLRALVDHEEQQIQSMAEQAATQPDWAEIVQPGQEGREPDSDAPLQDVPSFRLRVQQATLQIQPEAWLVVAYEAALRDGYVGSISDWVHETVVYLFVLQGIKVEILATPPSERERILEEAGLADARA